jgi:hypothetical protein
MKITWKEEGNVIAIVKVDVIKLELCYKSLIIIHINIIICNFLRKLNLYYI